MKKIIVLFLILVLSCSIAYAGIFDWITGRVVEGTDPVKEQVKCGFLNSNSEQKCYTDDGKFACSTITSCVVEVSGENGQALRWKSSCGGEFYTAIDGNNEYVEFKCEQAQLITTPTTEESLVKEQIKCLFTNSNSEQKCYTDDGKFACSGAGSCIADVSGVKGMPLAWKSSCGGSVSTIIDGTNENAEFKCEAAPTPVPIPSPTPTSIELIKEQVKCVFLNSNSEQTCYGSFSQTTVSCSGVGSCLAGISGEKGAKPYWKSSCGGYGTTIIDGANEYVEFSCAQPTATTNVPQPTQTQPSTLINEQVKCVFANSDSLQKCYSEISGCAGTGTCIADVSGEKGKTLTWKSSCDGYVYTTIDGNNEYAQFQCAPTTTTQITITTPVPNQPTVEAPVEFIKEQVKCVFANSGYIQKCYTDNGRFGCSGQGTCVADVGGGRGTKLAWKSSCGSYAYTVIDGNNEYAEFKCEPIQSTATEPVPTPVIIKEQVKCVFANSVSTQSCGAEGFQCSGTGTCVADISGEKGKMITWKSTCGGYAYTIIDGNNDYAEFNCQQISTPILPQIQTQPAQTIPTQACTDSDGDNYFLKGYVDSNGMRNFDTCRVINSNTDYYDTSECSGANCYVLESACTESRTARSYVWKCPNECKDGTCTKGEVKEQIRCVFSDPELIQRCYADSGKLGCSNIKRECYTDDGKFRCSDITVESRPTEGEGFRYTPFCIAEVSGNIGAKLTWKSTCGGYAYTVMDGNNEDVEFNCVPASDVTSEQISGKGFLHAYWQCYDGTEEKSIEGVDLTTCKSSEIWQEYARESCKNRCYPDRSKCGVNSFSVSGECYIDVQKEGVFISSVGGEIIEAREVEIKQEAKGEETKEKPIEEKKEAILICKDSCPLNGKCYPFGYRKEAKFCSDSGDFTDQLQEDLACDNNFECLTNVCVDGKCLSSGLIQKFMGWFKKLFGKADKEEAKEDNTEIEDCGASNECMENAFKICKPAKISQQGGPISEIAIVGLEGKKCVLKFVAGNESMECKFENYALGMKDMGSGYLEQYCSGTLTYRLTAAPKMMKQEAHMLNSVLAVTKLSADPNDQRYSFSAQDPDGISELRIIKSDFGQVSVKAEPPCTKEFTAELNFNPSDLPLRASLIDCGTPVIRQELNVDIQTPISPASATETQPQTPDVQKSARPTVELFVMSHCPYGAQAEKGMMPVAELLGNKIDFEIKFVNYAMHGEKEVLEQMNQHCIKTEQGTKFLPYLKCFLKEGDGESCLSEIGIDNAKLEACAKRIDVEFKITENMKNPIGTFPAFLINDAECKRYGVQGSPTLVVNGKSVNSARSPAAFLETICNAFNEPPAECEKELDSANPSTGFGFTTQQNVQEPISTQQKTSDSELLKEQVICKFIDQDLVQRCYADFGKLGCSNIIRKCYSADGKFGCSWTGGITSMPIENGFRYTPDCIAEVYGEQGTKLTWKSSCGGDSYTVIDSSNEDAIFLCMPLGSQIKGFLHAFWKCGNGVEEKSIEGVDLTTCKSSEIWNEYAKESCKNQGGIKDFSVSEDCSIAVEKEGVFIST